MLRSVRILGLSLAAFAALAVPTATVQAQEPARRDPAQRCGTQDLPSWEEEIVERELQKTMLSFHGSLKKGPNFVPPYWEKTIPVYFHFLRPASPGIPYEYVLRSQIRDQMLALNASYDVNTDPGNTEFNFVHAGSTITYNDAWHQDCGDANEAAIKSALAVDPAHNLNVYVCDGMIVDGSSGVIGYSYLPSQHSEGSFMHGVVMLAGTFPDGSAWPYDEGDTLVHEVGHYLGLHHTFKGGCTATNDSVSDTPQEKEAAFGCPYGQDTCPANPGSDPVFNFMDYTDDACMNHFTKGQKWRMKAQVTTYKPSL